MTTALYRRYRPDTFTEVIGQEHVTEPLMQALRADKVTHAYLFSGPRGCGKTTSARILARCLNCAQGPTPTPCGECDSCRELGRGGPGSLDVVEIDAASHNGVDDARDLRERAAFAPARDRFKIFILDEAHMVTPQGFNALLKIVEEPPPHVKFIFATTEPDKVIGTIRSRTHHYPFRLVAPDTLQPYLEQMCVTEGVAVGPGVLPLVVRAGGGSVRDSLSVLDQLVAGAGPEGIDYERAVALLGYTHAALLDDTVDALSARDGASAFRVVDRVVSSGHEPRRFVEDLLERLRDLIVIAASGDAARAVLRDLPADQLERMRVQATVLGAAELSRSADLVNAALSEMTGATSPRLHLELLVARLLLPSVDDGVRGVGARLDRVERELGRVGAGEGVGVGAPRPPREPVPGPAAGTAHDPAPGAARTPDGEPAAVAHRGPDRALAPEPVRAPAAARAPDAEPTGPAPAGSAAEGPSTSQPTQHTAAPLEAEMVRRRWPEVLATLRGLRMATWVLVSQNAQVSGATSEVVTLAFTTPQLASAFRVGPHAENVRTALH
ncbi:MAG TPA: DNA polymerase III subunit gamma and tau, partial [Actinotalea sp.]|nr:DNA polymerase III subunit gamma and tau [Actinotalea sp.]